MNNVTTLFSNNTAVNGLRDKGYGSADFDIGVAPVLYEDDLGILHSADKKKVIYRLDNSLPLGVHGSRYEAVAPKVMIDSTRNILERSDLNLTGVTERIATSHNGSRTFVQYNLPAHKYTTPDGDTACLSLLATTSFDSTWPFLISAAAVQSACLNLQVFISGEVAVYRSKHTKGLDIDKGSRIIVNALDVFENERDLWETMYNTDMSEERAFLMFCQAAGHRSAIDYMKENPNWLVYEVRGSVRHNPNTEHMWLAYKNYVRRFGHTEWAAYNTMTDWSTHAPASKRSGNNVASVKSQRQESVRKVVSTWGVAA